MNNIFCWAIVKEHLRRFWAISALGGVVYFIVVGLGVMTMRADNQDLAIVHSLVSILSMRDIIVSSMVVIPLAAVVCVMGFFNSPQAATVFYALPVSKHQLMASSVLAGVILTLLPLLILIPAISIPVVYPGTDPATVSQIWSNGVLVSTHSTFSTLLFPSGVAVGGVVNTFPVILLFILRVAIAKLFYFGLFWLAHSLTGHGIIAVLLAGVLPLTPAALFVFWQYISAFYVFGHLQFVFSDTLGDVIAYTNPAMWQRWFARSWDEYRVESTTIFYFLYSGMAILFFIAAYVTSIARKPERTGNSVMFRPVKNVLVFIVAAGCMFIVGLIALSSTRGVMGYYVGMVIGFAGGYVIAQMLAEKSFIVWHKMKYIAHFGGIAIVLYGCIWLFAQFGMGFYVNFIPDKEDVTGVFIEHNIHGRMMWINFIEDPDAISLAMDAHRQIIDGGRQGGSNKIHFWTTHTTSYVQFPITYRLRGGGTVQRTYMLSPDFYANSLLPALFTHEGVVFRNYAVLDNFDEITSIQLWYTEAFQTDEEFRAHQMLPQQQDPILINDPESIVLIAEALRQDIMARAETELQSRLGQRQRLENEPVWDRTLSATVHTTRPITDLAHRSGPWFYRDFENSERLLREWGYIE